MTKLRSNTMDELHRRRSELFKREDSNSDDEFHIKYEPKEILGRGLSSTVRRCVSRETGRDYAVKIIDKSQDDAIKESIDAEIRILSTLPRHPNIILLEDVFESPAFIFLVFELAQGGELFDYLTKMVKLSEKKTRQIMYQLFSAVEHMHAHHVVHRDLKPENILLGQNVTIKISDFGFSTTVAEGQQLSELLGTPGYLAPEMLKRSVEPGAPGYGVEVDLWACGVIMYTLLVGFPPFWHRKQLVMLRNIMEGKYEFVSPEWDGISDNAKDMVRSLLVTNPQKRMTASQALSHPFLQFQAVDFKIFSGKRKFKAAVFCVWSCNTLGKMHKTSQTLSLNSVGTVPYEQRYIRTLIDTCAFHIYGHWVKRGEEQNRAALFETTPKMAHIPDNDSLKKIRVAYNTASKSRALLA